MIWAPMGPYEPNLLPIWAHVCAILVHMAPMWAHIMAPKGATETVHTSKDPNTKNKKKSADQEINLTVRLMVVASEAWRTRLMDGCGLG